MHKIISCIILCLLISVALHAQDISRRTLELYRQGKINEAALLLASVKHHDTSLFKWLELRLALDLEKFEAAATCVDRLLQEDSKIWEPLWRGPLMQGVGELLFHQKKLNDATYWFESALRHGGADIEDDRILFLLMRIAFEQNDPQLSKRYARLLWYSWPLSPFRMRAGLFYAQAIAEVSHTEARAVLSEIRLKAGSRSDIYIQASVLLIGYLFERHPDQAERIAVEAMRRLGTLATDELRIWHALSVLQLNPIRGQQLLNDLPLKDYPQLKTYVDNFVGSSAEELARALSQARVAIEAERHQEVLGILKDHWQENLDALDLCLRAGLLPSVAAQSEHSLKGLIAVRLYLAAKTLEPSFDGRAHIAKALDSLFVDDDWTAADLSLFVLATDLHIITQDTFIKELKRIESLDVKHEALGMLLCRLAQEAHKRKSHQAAEWWEMALKRLPNEHPWFASCAEQLGLLSLRPVAPGRVVDSLDESERRRLQLLVTSLSEVAWKGSDEQHLRCRYLLAQSLSQLGKVSEARICFKSLSELADNARKVRIDRALRLLADYDSRQ